ncbi:hypothetical protein, partial [Bacteroides caccae]|uniref:hypothetical protein n=1 Tax=Bacteroides caccae TaxID=47678 RepID=UPI0019608849
VKNLTWQNPEQLFVAQELINKVKSKCCGIKDIIKYCIFAFENIKYLHKIQEGYIKIKAEKVHLNIQIIFKVLIFYYLLPFT